LVLTAGAPIPFWAVVEEVQALLSSEIARRSAVHGGAVSVERGTAGARAVEARSTSVADVVERAVDRARDVAMR